MYDDFSSPDRYSPEARPPQRTPQTTKKRQTLEQARLSRFKAQQLGFDVGETIGRQMRDLEEVKRQAGVSGGSANSMSVGSVSGVSEWEGDASERVNDLKVQIDAAKRQLSIKEDKLKSLQSSLYGIDTRRDELRMKRRQKEAELQRLRDISNQPAPTYKHHPEPEPENADLSVFLQSEKKKRKEVEARIVEEEAALRATRAQHEAELQRLERELETSEGMARASTDREAGKLEAVRSQMQGKLAKVKEEMHEQFNEERQKLESRVEYLTRMNDRKDHEIDSLQQKKTELNAIVEQVKKAHKETIASYQGRHEHENKQTIQHESNASKHERELRMTEAEIGKLKDRIRKAGGPLPLPRAKSPASTRKGTTATPKYK